MPFVSAAVSWKTRRSPVTGLCRVSPERSISVFSLSRSRRCDPSIGERVRHGNAAGASLRGGVPAVRGSGSRLLGGRLGDRLLLRVGLGRDGGFGRGTRLRRPLSVLSQLADARLAPDLAAEVVQLRAVDVADRRHVDLVDLRRMERERSLDADAEGVLAHREGLARARALALDHDPLEHLDPLARALDDAEVDADGVARLEPRYLAQLTALDVLDDRAHVERWPEPRGMVAESLPDRDPVGRPVRCE